MNDDPDLPDWATCKHEPVAVETLFGDWTFCRHCHKQWTEEIDREYNLRKRYTPTYDEGSLC